MSVEYAWKTVTLSGGATPLARRYFTVVNHEDKFYLFGGHKPSKEATNDFSLFDPKVPKYEAVSCEGALPPLRGGHSAVVADGKMWVFGGISGKTSLNDLHVFDFASKTWEEIRAGEGEVWPAVREFHSAVVFNGDMFIFGGSNGIKKYKNDLFKFNFQRKKFTVLSYLPDLTPEGRAGHLAFLRGSEMIVFGGYCGDGGFTYLGDMLALPLDAPDDMRKWKTLEGKGLAAATARPITHAQVGNKILIFGGYAGDQPTSLFRTLNMETLEWTFNELWMAVDTASLSTISTSESTKATKPFARYGHGTAIDSQGTVYVFCGTGSMYLTDIVELSSLE